MFLQKRIYKNTQAVESQLRTSPRTLRAYGSPPRHGSGADPREAWATAQSMRSPRLHTYSLLYLEKGRFAFFGCCAWTCAPVVTGCYIDCGHQADWIGNGCFSMPLGYARRDRIEAPGETPPEAAMKFRHCEYLRPIPTVVTRSPIRTFSALSGRICRLPDRDSQKKTCACVYIVHTDGWVDRALWCSIVGSCCISHNLPCCWA